MTTHAQSGDESIWAKMAKPFLNPVDHDKLAQAREALADLEDPDNQFQRDYVNTLVANVHKHTADAGVELQHLDSSPKCTNTDIENRIDTASKRHYLQEAQTRFAAFEETTETYCETNIDSLREHILSLLEDADALMDGLDPSGESSEMDMARRMTTACLRARFVSAGYQGQELSDIVAKTNALPDDERLGAAQKALYVHHARAGYEQLKTTETPISVGSIEYIAKSVQDNLERAGEKFAALDQSSDLTSYDMRKEFEKAVRYAHLVSACGVFEKLATMPAADRSEKDAVMASQTRQHLEAAQKGPQTVAEKTGLPVTLVRSVLSM